MRRTDADNALGLFQLPGTETVLTRWSAWYDCDARCPWRTPSGCRADALDLQPSAAYGTNCRRRQRRRRKDDPRVG